MSTDLKIRLHNSKSHSKEDFVPIDPQNVRMYVCGPTVYDRAHLGNARPVIVFDVLFRLLQEAYGSDHVTYVRNFTDIDDKINAKAAATSRDIRDITDQTAQWFLEDMAAVGALNPTAMPRATQYVPQMIAMIQDLEEKGHTYESEGHVLFDVNSFAAYGALSGRSLDDMLAGARVERAAYKRDPMDFVLWKPSDDTTPGWDSPWGRGRPGWHIECSAMSNSLLGPEFDIHGGGNDLTFPHHENEIAQSCCANPGSSYANVWLHNEMLQVDGKKMAKSAGNFFTVSDLLNSGIHGEVIRFVMLSTHYRKPMDWTANKAQDALETLTKWYGQIRDVAAAPFCAEVFALLADDLNTHGVLTLCHSLSATGDYAQLRAALSLLGLVDTEVPDWSTPSDYDFTSVEILFNQTREKALKTKDFSDVDRLKSALTKAGVEVQMSKSSVKFTAKPGFSPEETGKIA